MFYYFDSIIIHFIIQVAWSVARTSSQSWGYVQYPVVLVNEGGAWNVSSHKAVISRDGYYFIHVGGGIPSGKQPRLYLKVNNKRTLSAVHWSDNHNGTDTISRSAILKLSVGDELKVNLFNYLYSDNQMQTIFIGFLL